MKTKIYKKMIDFYEGSVHDIEHFMKVHAYAKLIGELECLDSETLSALELAAIVHDISCPLCREKYGTAAGNYQEAESEALLRPFLAEYQLPDALLGRIIELVSHHHSPGSITGKDFDILIEADFLVNAAEENMSKAQIAAFVRSTAKTESAKALFHSIYKI